MKVAVVAALSFFVAGTAAAHDARPVTVTVIEDAHGIYRAVVRMPPSLPGSNLPILTWPQVCEDLDPNALAASGRSFEYVRRFSCSDALAGASFRIEYPIYNPSLSTMFRLETAAGRSMTTILPPDQDSWTVPEAPTFVSVARDYALLGFKHILGGPDHLAFVAGLLLLARRPRRILWAVTGFTAAHSITLSAAATGAIRVPIEPTEAMIALSIVFLATEIARTDADSFSRRYPIALAFAFGLLHGLGFASALGEIGLPDGELLAGLLFFNIGVELGQLAFIAAAAIVVAACRRMSRPLRRHGDAGISLAMPGTYLLGVPAAFWFVERAAAMLQG